jgi:hypothetical protein
MRVLNSVDFTTSTVYPKGQRLKIRPLQRGCLDLAQPAIVIGTICTALLFGPGATEMVGLHSRRIDQGYAQILRMARQTCRGLPERILPVLLTLVTRFLSRSGGRQHAASGK